MEFFLLVEALKPLGFSEKIPLPLLSAVQIECHSSNARSFHGKMKLHVEQTIFFLASLATRYSLAHYLFTESRSFR